MARFYTPPASENTLKDMYEDAVNLDSSDYVIAWPRTGADYINSSVTFADPMRYEIINYGLISKLID